MRKDRRTGVRQWPEGKVGAEMGPEGSNEGYIMWSVFSKSDLKGDRVNLMCEWARVYGEEGDEVAAEEGELEAHLGNVVRVHRQSLRKT